MIHEYTLKTADTQRQLVDNTGQPLRFMRYLGAEAAMKVRKDLFVHTQSGPEPLADDVTLIVCTAGINWDVSLAPLGAPASVSPARAGTKIVDGPLPTVPAQKAPAQKPPAPTPPVASATPASTRTRSALPTRTTSTGAITVPCPSCHQQPGVLCTTKDGKPTTPHKLRLAASKRGDDPQVASQTSHAA